MLARQSWLLPILALLGACNIAVSDKPMFSEEQRSSTLILADGLWVREKPDCEFDRSKPKEKWPKCADWMILKASKAIDGSDMKPEESVEDVFIADGDPPLIQAKIEPKDDKVIYGFLVLKVEQIGPSGKVRSGRAWTVPCGTSQNGSTKISPYPGFSEECMPSSVAALRAAAAKGAAEPDDIVELRWVRDEVP